MVDAQRHAGSLANCARAALAREHRLVVCQRDSVDFSEPFLALVFAGAHELFLSVCGIGAPSLSPAISDLLLVALVVIALNDQYFLSIRRIVLPVMAASLVDLVPVAFVIAPLIGKLSLPSSRISRMSFRCGCTVRTHLWTGPQIHAAELARPVTKRAQTRGIDAPAWRRTSSQTHVVAVLKRLLRTRRGRKRPNDASLPEGGGKAVRSAATMLTRRNFAECAFYIIIALRSQLRNALDGSKTVPQG